MSSRRVLNGATIIRAFTWLLIATVAAQHLQIAWAGCCFRFRQQSVGGIAIDAEGVVSQATVDATATLSREMLSTWKKAPADLNQPTEIRKISLRALDQAIGDALRTNQGMLPDEVQYLAGIQRIQYVFLVPEEKDIVLAGPGEGWKIDEKGNVVGVTTGRPVIQLDDLLVALRTASAARRVGISCSIDPTPEGRRNLDAYLGTLKQFNPGVVQGVEKALGPQKITLTGVPETSHFARVLVAADYRMKRIAMKLEPSPVRGLPSYVDMITSASGNVMPRWWMACNYEPLMRSADGLAWELRGPGVKTMTEDEFISPDGTVRGTGKTSVPAQRWADLMTSKYEELAAVEPVFGELRNLMDLCVVAALLEKEDLYTQAGCPLSLLRNNDSAMTVDTAWHAPRTVATQCSALKKGTNWIITASGGVQVESWQAAARTQVGEQVGQVRAKAITGRQQNWWWN